MIERATMAFLLNSTEHTVGDHHCVECYRGYPAKCVCGGFIHAQFVKESWENEVELAFACDSCDQNFKFPGQNSRKKFRFSKRKSYRRK